MPSALTLYQKKNKKLRVDETCFNTFDSFFSIGSLMCVLKFARMSPVLHRSLPISAPTVEGSFTHLPPASTAPAPSPTAVAVAVE